MRLFLGGRLLPAIQEALGSVSRTDKDGIKNQKNKEDNRNLVALADIWELRKETKWGFWEGKYSKQN